MMVIHYKLIDLWFHGHDLWNNKCITRNMGSIEEVYQMNINHHVVVKLWIIVTINDKCVKQININQITCLMYGVYKKQLWY